MRGAQRLSVRACRPVLSSQLGATQVNCTATPDADECCSGHGTPDAGGLTCTCDAGWGRQAYATDDKSSCRGDTLGPSEPGVASSAACQWKCATRESCAHAVWKHQAHTGDVHVAKMDETLGH